MSQSTRIPKRDLARAMLSEVSLVMFIDTFTRRAINKPSSFDDWDTSEAYT